MVLNIVDFVKSGKSLQTLWNASKTALKLFVTACATVWVDLGCIWKGRNWGDFDQKAWAIAHGFEHGRFFELLEIAPNSLKRLQTVLKWFVTACPTVCVDLVCICKSRKLAYFEQKACAIAHGFEHGRFREICGNRTKPSERSPKSF